MPDSIERANERRRQADVRNFYKVEKWTKDGMKVDSLLCTGNSLEMARAEFEHAIKHRPRIRLTLRQRMRVLDEWPRGETMLGRRPRNARRREAMGRIVATRPHLMKIPGSPFVATKINPGQSTLPGLLQVDASTCGLL
jgi:hypothetical protein